MKEKVGKSEAPVLCVRRVMSAGLGTSGLPLIPEG